VDEGFTGIHHLANEFTACRRVQQARTVLSKQAWAFANRNLDLASKGDIGQNCGHASVIWKKKVGERPVFDLRD